MNSFRKNRLLSKLVIAILTVLVSGVLVLAENDPDFKQWLSINQPGQYSVLEISDGDTITVNVNGRAERVRMIGVDTPELHHPEKPVQCFARAAQAFTATMIGGDPVRLEADQLDDNRDLYGRLLRYIYSSDGRLINAELIREGYGFAYTHFPFIRLEEFRQLERDAREQNRGLWSGCSLNQTDRGLEASPVE